MSGEKEEKSVQQNARLLLLPALAQSLCLLTYTRDGESE